MHRVNSPLPRAFAVLGVLLLAATPIPAAHAGTQAGPTVKRLTPPSMLFSFNDPGTPITSRFLPGQRFDLQATIAPVGGATFSSVSFLVDNVEVASTLSTVTLTPATAAGLPAGTQVATSRAYANLVPGVHELKVKAVQSDNLRVEAKGNFEVVKIDQKGRRARNVIIMLGDGMGIAHRTAARIVAFGAQQGKANDRLEMDKFPYTGLVMTHSLNSIVTDSAPGMACYSSGNKANNNQEGVFPDDTTDPFDNPRVEYMGEFLHRTQGKSLGLVTTADVFDATPAANAIHTSDRGAGTGICDQYLDESGNNGLSVLLGGGRKWFLPKGTAGSVRANGNDYKLPAELATAWGVPTGAKDETRDLLGDFQTAGWTYAANRTDLDGAPPATTKLLGLFSFSNMNIAKDKIDGRRGVVPPGSATGNPVVSDYGFPDQPLLEEMTAKALTVLNKNPQGFVLMVEGASIDKQAHNMDSERWILDTIEFDHAVGVVRKFVEANPDTLVVITADHECSGANIIGASTKKAADLAATASADLRKLVGTYDLAGFPSYSIAADGYPTTTEPDYKLLIGYAANADRYEDWQTNPFPAHDSQQPFDTVAPLSGYPRINSSDNSGAVNPLRPIRDVATGFPITGHVDGNQAVHTASDIPCSALGRGAAQFTGVLDNTDLFFRMLQAAVGGAL